MVENQHIELVPKGAAFQCKTSTKGRLLSPWKQTKGSRLGLREGLRINPFKNAWHYKSFCMFQPALLPHEYTPKM